MQPAVRGTAPFGTDPRADASVECTATVHTLRLDLLPPGSLQGGCTPGPFGLPWRCNLADLALEVNGKLRELASWQPSERTEHRLGS